MEKKEEFQASLKSLLVTYVVQRALKKSKKQSKMLKKQFNA